MLALLVASRARAQCPDGAPPPCRASSARAAPPPATSVAVLYFDNLSRDTSDTYLADGFSEEVISRLSQVERLQVKSRTAVRRYRGRDVTDPAAIGQALAVAHLVSGSVRRDAGRLRITVELVRVSSGNTIWSRSFDRSTNDLISAEAEIAESVAVNVGGRIAPAERRRIETRPTRNAEAYDRFLRGRFEIARRTRQGIMTAMREFEAAARLDSGFTSAIVWYSAAARQLGTLYYEPEVGIPRDTLGARADVALERALRQDPTSVEAVLAKATYSDPTLSRAAVARAVLQEPRNPDAHHTYGLTLRILGEDSAAVAEFRKATDIEPDRIISLHNLAQTHFMARRYREAKFWFDSVMALRPEAYFYYLENGLNRLMLGDTAGARVMSGLTTAHGAPTSGDELLALIEVRAGDSASARRRALRADSAMAGRECFISHECLELALTLANVGLADRAIAALERITPRSAWLAFWIRRPEFDVIRGDERYQALLRESRAPARR